MHYILQTYGGVKMVRIIILVLVSFVSITGYAEIYSWKDVNGRLHYSDVPPKSIKSQSIEIKLDNGQGSAKNSAKNKKVKFTYEKPKRRGLTKKKVVMYATSWCGYCAKARKYFQDNNIAFVEYDVEKNAAKEKEFKRLGGTGFPLIIIGKKKMMGFSANRFDKIYSM